MKFEPGEKYLCVELGEVTYIGLSSEGWAVVETKTGGVFKTMFDDLSRLKKKQRFWIELPRELSISDFACSVLVHSNLNYLKTYCHQLAEAKHNMRIIEVETVEPVDPL